MLVAFVAFVTLILVVFVAFAPPAQHLSADAQTARVPTILQRGRQEHWSGPAQYGWRHCDRQPNLEVAELPYCGDESGGSMDRVTDDG
jgi:hypothetical protein